MEREAVVTAGSGAGGGPTPGVRVAAVLAVALVLGPGSSPAAGQQQGVTGLQNRDAFRALDLPTPNEYRAGSGRPGDEYWQQEVSYDVRVRLDPESHRVSGSETITYTNWSPEPLERIWLQLDQNLFDPASRGARITPPDRRFSGAFEGGGYDISRVEVERGGRRRTPEYTIRGTRMRIDLREPLAADGGRLELHLDYGFTVPRYGADRMGRLDVEQGTVYELAQWYPRVYTYDDVRGWNVLPYLGLGEFYLEYGSFDVEITVPRDFVVVATGRLRNPGTVLTGEQRRRMEEARQSAEAVPIIAKDEVGEPGTRPEGSGPLTWKFHADGVRDFSWAASQAFIWDAASWEDVLVMSAYPKEGLGSVDRPGWEASTRYVRHSVRHYSETWHRYPYPVAINVAGRVGGMEYPMIVFCSVRARGRGLFGVTDHEIGHSWFPMLVGSDERRHFWMDEGLNTFMNHYSTRAFYGADRAGPGPVHPDTLAMMMQSPLGAQPIVTRSDRLRESTFGFTAYRKPAAGLHLLREYVVGPEDFDPAFRAYIRRWAYRHPKPADFFRTMENVTGQELDWFWRGWFYETDVLDQAVTAVERQGDRTRIRLESRAGLVMPLELEIGYTDGSTGRRRLPVEVWHTSDVFTEVVSGKRVERVTVDPRRMLPDVDRSNNVWRRPGGS